MDWGIDYLRRILFITVLLSRLCQQATTDPVVGGAGTEVNPSPQDVGAMPPQQPIPTTGLNPTQGAVPLTNPLGGGATQQQGNVPNWAPNPMQPQTAPKTSPPNGEHRRSNRSKSSSDSLSSRHSHKRGRRRGSGRHSSEISSRSRNHRSHRGSNSGRSHNSRSSSSGSSRISVNGHSYPASCLFTSSFVVWTSRGRRTKVHSAEDRRRVRDYASLCLQWQMKQRDYEQGLAFTSTHAAPPPFYNGLQPTSLHQPPPFTWRFPIARPPPAMPEPPCLPECEKDDRHGCSDVLMIDDEEASRDDQSRSSESRGSSSMSSRSSSHSRSRSSSGSKLSERSHGSGRSSSRKRSSSRSSSSSRR